MKKLLETILVWLIAVLVPYFLVAVLHGFNFNMDDWSESMGFQYVICTLSLAFLLTMENKTKK